MSSLQACADEDVDLAEGALETLAKASRGDLRRAITSLQSAVRLKVTPIELLIQALMTAITLTGVISCWLHETDRVSKLQSSQ